MDCQNDLSESIQKLNPKSRLFVLREAPQTLFPKLFEAWDVTHLVFERDTDSYARERDRVVTDLAREAGVEVITRYGRTLWDSDEVVARHGGRPTMSLTQLQAAGHKIGEVPKPIPAPERLPDPGDMPLDFEQGAPEAIPDLNAPHRGGGGGDRSYARIAGPGGDFAVVGTLEELGLAPATTPHRGGETAALRRLREVVASGDGGYAATFRKPRTSPAAFDPPSTTLLSPALHFGALSPRLFYWRAREAADAHGSGASRPPESLTGQLLFRDMYFAAQAATGPPFARALGNPHCRFVPWHLPSEAGHSGGGGGGGGGGGDEYHVDSARADRWFRRWRAGTTGFPFVDALMRQLRLEGWIHHLGRHVVACLLTRGGCYVHWERGAGVFAELLLDHEPACNAGNWQWLSCTAFCARYYRVYSPVAFGRRWDPRGHLIRRYVPELAGLDDKYIYEPWKAPQEALDRAGVRIGGDGLEEEEERERERERDGTYPAPMFDFGERRRACLAAMKTAYSVGLYGDDEKARNGTWRELFEKTGRTEMQDDIDSTDDDGEHADDADHEVCHGKHGRSKSDAPEEGPMDRYIKKPKS